MGPGPLGFLFILEGPNAAKRVEVVWWPFGERDKGTARGSNSTNTSTCIIIYLFFCVCKFLSFFVGPGPLFFFYFFWKVCCE